MILESKGEKEEASHSCLRTPLQNLSECSWNEWSWILDRFHWSRREL